MKDKYLAAELYLEAVTELYDLVMADKSYNLPWPYQGICLNVQSILHVRRLNGYLSYSIMHTFHQFLISSWSELKKDDLVNPIIEDRTEPAWSGDQLKQRISLMEHMIDELEEMLNE